MPKISDERKAERREQILAGARRCFAKHGYEGATVARLEEFSIDTRPLARSVFVYSLDQDKTFPVSDGLAAVSDPVFDVDGKYLYFFGSTDEGPVRDWFSQWNNDMRATRTIYMVVLRNDLQSPLAKESDEEKGTPAPPEDAHDAAGRLPSSFRHGAPRPTRARRLSYILVSAWNLGGTSVIMEHFDAEAGCVAVRTAGLRVPTVDGDQLESHEIALAPSVRGARGCHPIRRRDRNAGRGASDGTGRRHTDRGDYGGRSCTTRRRRFLHARWRR